LEEKRDFQRPLVFNIFDVKAAGLILCARHGTNLASASGIDEITVEELPKLQKLVKYR